MRNGIQDINRGSERASAVSDNSAVGCNSTAFASFMYWASIAAAALAMGIGGFWLVAWLSGVVPEWSMRFITVKSNMAFALVLAGIALLILPKASSRGWRWWAGVVLSSVVLIVGVLTLSEHLFGWNLGIDQLIATEPPGALGVLAPNRMGLPGALSLLLLGLGLLCLGLGRKAIASYFALAVIIINMVPAVGYLYGVPQFYERPGLTGIAWSTVIALFSLGLGVLFTNADSKPISMLMRNDPGGALLRRLLPVTILVPLVLGFLRVLGQYRGFYDTATGTGMLVLALVIIFSAMLWRSAAGLSRSTEAEREVQDTLRQNEERLSATFHKAGVGIVEVDKEDRFIAVNDRALEVLGYSREELLQMNVHALTAPEDRNLSDDMNARLHAGEFDRLDYEKRYLRRDGSPVWVHVTVTAIRDAAGHHLGAITIVENITDRKQAEEQVRKLNVELEQRVAQRTAELEDANKELEAFSYSVSHDLRAPLRVIDGFSSTLLKRYHDSLDPQGQDYLERVRAAAQRMSKLIDDILGLSRAGRAEIHWRTVDVSTMAIDVFKELRESNPERRVETVVQPEITADADPSLLRIILDNLLGNAWKFTSRKEAARIEVGAFEENNEQIHFVKDSGAGFNPAYADKLFVPFQRLHNESDFPGTGIGLALVQRIIRRHGGRIWAEGEVDKGATFYFTLGEADK